MCHTRCHKTNLPAACQYVTEVWPYYTVLHMQDAFSSISSGLMSHEQWNPVSQQCVPPTGYWDLILMTPERNTAESQSSIRCYGKNLWQSRINILSNLFRHPSNYRVECILIEVLTDFYSLCFGEWIEVTLLVNLESVIITRVEICKHTPWRQRQILAGQVILEWQ